MRARVVAVVLVTATAVIAPAATAGAHVSIEPPTAQPGSFATLTFRVPNESASAATNRVRVQLPADHPLTSVLVRPVPGWTITTEKVTPTEGQDGNVVETVSVISWEGGRIEPGYYENFELTVGPLPEDTDVLYFPTIQYYDDGTEAAWIERPGASGEEPEQPAPELDLTGAATGARDSHGQTVDAEGASGEAGTESAAPAATAATTNDDSSSAVTVASISLGIALVALVAAAVAWFLAIRARRSTPPS